MVTRSQSRGSLSFDAFNGLNELASTHNISQVRSSIPENSIGRAQSQLESQDEEAGIFGLDELDVPPPDENPEESPIRYHRSLEDERDRTRRSIQSRESAQSDNRPKLQERLLVKLHSISWLIFFSILGTLARLGAEWLAYYPNAPVISNVLWANFGGCLVLGFLQEDRALFREQEGRSLSSSTEEEKTSETQRSSAEHLAHKKTLPLFIGLSVGFCGSFTSYSSFMRDLFLGLSNTIVGKNTDILTRSPGWSFCSVLSMIILEVSVSLFALTLGAHIAIVLFPLLSKIPKINHSGYMNALAIFLGFGCWLGAIFLAIWPPDDIWRGEVVFAIVFAPLGTLLRFFLSMKLNPYISSFPLGTFTANILGTAILGMAYDLQHTSIPIAGSKVGGGYLGCQIVSGVMEGFCGCLTTVSTWVVELKALRRRHAYVYGIMSIAIGFPLLIAIIGSLQWTSGLQEPTCAK